MYFSIILNFPITLFNDFYELFTLPITYTPTIPELNFLLASNLDFKYTAPLNFINTSDQVSHLNIPNIKLYYPEPFIATPTFSHDDIWFLHITIYQYWLWFFFCFIIIFFFITFLITVRWCNIRHKPVRETRGVSRSKCGDLITATVPVSWAASIIVHESTDAIELADGFGTSELAVGIRAYQWGWEYYYPRDLNLMLSNGETSIRLGSSLAYWSDLHSINYSSKFKNYLYSSNSTNQNFSSMYNLSFITNQTSDFVTDVNTVSNKLIARISCNLITSPRLFSIRKNLINATQNFNTRFNNLAFSDFVSGKPCNRKTLFNFIHSNSIFFNNFSTLNHRDLMGFISTVSGTKSQTYLFNFNRILYTKPFFFNNFRSLQNNSIDYNSKIQYDYSSYFSNLESISSSFKLAPELYISKFINNTSLYRLFLSTNWFFFYQYAGTDFRRWSLTEMLEESIMGDVFNTNYLLKEASSLNELSSRKFSEFNYVITSILNYQPHSFNVNSSGCFPYITTNDQNYYRYLTDNIFSITSSGARTFFLKKLIDNLTELNKTQAFYTFKWEFLPMSVVDLSSSFASKTIEYLPLELNFSFNHYSYTGISDTFTNFTKSSKIISNNSLNLISNFKSLITYYQAFWKIFKTSLEEERSNYNYSLLSNTSTKLPLIHDNSSVFTNNYNKVTFDLYFINTFKRISAENRNLLDFNLNFSWDYFLYPFPFTTAFDSDIIRYIWFDWYSTRGQIVTKALDTSVFNLYGVKDFNYNFKSPDQSKVRLINVTENFYTKFAQARQFYISNFQYTPFYLNKFLKLTSEEFIFKSHINLNLSFKSMLSLNSTLPLTTSFNLMQYSYKLDFNPFNLNNKRLSGLLNLNQNQADTLNNVLNIQSKCRYLISSLNLDNFYSKNTSTPIVEFDSNLQHLENYIKDLTSVYADITNYSYKNDGNFIVKNQYQPLKKGIHNMIRIQADRAVAMPTDTRLQILAVSKDIIHSWSIPSAGIKIDCIPGYSSHRILMFTLSGIYWGQCMEICGRFHHWMPIVVYFIRRDLFCIWCVHFVFKNQQVDLTYQSNEHEKVNFNLNLSYQYNSWNLEL